MPSHVFESAAAPLVAPNLAGSHHVDSTAEKFYLAVGTSSVDKWKRVMLCGPVGSDVAGLTPDGRLILKDPSTSEWFELKIQYFGADRMLYLSETPEP